MHAGVQRTEFMTYRSVLGRGAAPLVLGARTDEASPAVAPLRCCEGRGRAMSAESLCALSEAMLLSMLIASRGEACTVAGVRVCWSRATRGCHLARAGCIICGVETREGCFRDTRATYCAVSCGIVRDWRYSTDTPLLEQ